MDHKDMKEIDLTLQTQAHRAREFVDDVLSYCRCRVMET